MTELDIIFAAFSDELEKVASKNIRVVLNDLGHRGKTAVGRAFGREYQQRQALGEVVRRVKGPGRVTSLFMDDVTRALRMDTQKAVRLHADSTPRKYTPMALSAARRKLGMYPYRPANADSAKFRELVTAAAQRSSDKHDALSRTSATQAIRLRQLAERKEF